MQNDAGELADLYIPRKWFVFFGKYKVNMGHFVSWGVFP